MNPWWTQAAAEQWGTPLFHAVFWPLTCLGAWAARPARSRAGFLIAGMVLGVGLIVAGLVAVGAGQPRHVWERLVLFGGVFGAVHTSLLAAMVFTRRKGGQTGDVS